MIKLTKEHILNMHKMLVLDSGGSLELRDSNLLDSALNQPFQSFDSVPLYPSTQQKAARLAYGLIMNHPFVDGNKRIGVHSMLVLLSLNNIELNYSQEELYTIILDVASGKANYEDLLSFILSHQI